MIAKIFLGLGSNLGNREGHLQFAADAIDDLPGTRVIATTAAQETLPIGPPQGLFLNQMLLIESELEPHPLLAAIRNIERMAGRAPGERWGPRTLDIDICVFGPLTVNDPKLTIPHREIGNRAFWINQLAELMYHTWSRSEMGFPDWAQVSSRRLAHIDRVAGLLAAWAIIMKTTDAEKSRWLRAAYLHDALKDAPDDIVADLSRKKWGQLPLFHGPAAAEMARSRGELDVGVLDAVQYHTTGYEGWDEVGRMLYLADYLEPGRGVDPNADSPLVTLVPHDVQNSLRTVATSRREYALKSGHHIPAESTAFWAALKLNVD